MKTCKDCKYGSDGIPDCVIDGVCPLEYEEKNEAGKWQYK